MNSGLVSGGSSPLLLSHKLGVSSVNPRPGQNFCVFCNTHLPKSTPTASAAAVSQQRVIRPDFSKSVALKSNFVAGVFISNQTFSILFGAHLPRSASFKTFSIIGDEFATLSSDSSFYELLGISESVSLSEIKQAYKQMARKYHPDVSPPDRTEEYTRRFIRVQAAYETLSDPRTRAMYDRDLARGLHLAFSARKQFDEVYEPSSAWRNRWQDQVAELKRRSTNKEVSDDNLSWGARMRRQRKQSFAG